MSDLQQPSNPERGAQIDTIGWLFVAFVVAITSIGAMVAYQGNNPSPTTTAVVRVAGPSR